MSGERYSEMDGLGGFGFLVNALGGGGDTGQAFPQSDAEDFSRGAKFIPGEVTTARREGKTVTFVTSCQTSTCCWCWQMPNGKRIYHFERHVFEHLRDKHGGICPGCGNDHVSGGVVET